MAAGFLMDGLRCVCLRPSGLTVQQQFEVGGCCFLGVAVGPFPGVRPDGDPIQQQPKPPV